MSRPMTSGPLLALLVFAGCGSSTEASSTGAATGSTGSTGGNLESTSSFASAGSSSEGAESDGMSTGFADSTGAGEPVCVGENTIPFGGAVVVDGYMIQPQEGWSVPVGIKHDAEAITIAFAQLQPPGPPPFAVFPELLIDVGNEKLEALGPDDWWFHVSATDCAAAGRYDDYDGCVLEARTWEANNFPSGELIDAVEIRIPLQTLGIDQRQPVEIGIALRLSDTQGYAAHWPLTADPATPSTWATVQLCPEA